MERGHHKAPWQEGLYLAAGPIGHLGDISFRLAELLSLADLVVAEDTRRTVKLLNHLALKKTLLSYREQNHEKVWPKIKAVLAKGGRVALVSDAGSPVIADPGSQLVRAARESGFNICPIPGPSAVVTALMASGFWAERFIFGGFLPEKSAERRALVRQLDSQGLVMVVFEAPHRLVSSIADLLAELGPRPAFLAREMTKVFEEYLLLPLDELYKSVTDKPRKGEITLVIGPRVKNKDQSNQKGEPNWAEVEKTARQDPRSTAELAAALAEETGYSKKAIYSRLIWFRSQA
jgi:16S rRNA (cytidine1402-2'-O)-methyltransferase